MSRADLTFTAFFVICVVALLWAVTEGALLLYVFTQVGRRIVA